MINQKIKETIEHIERCGLDRSHQPLKNLYQYVLSHVQELKEVQFYQMTGALFSIIAYEKIPGLTRAANIAYYCLTQGAYIIQPKDNLQASIDNMLYSRVERVKLLLNGGIKLIADRVDEIDNLSAQEAVDISILGDVLYLKDKDFSCGETWWHRVQEDLPHIRAQYSHMTNDEIRWFCGDVHRKIAEKIYEDLVEYSKLFGFN